MTRDVPPYALNIMFRAGHSYVWELADKSGILEKLGLSIATLDEADWAGKADEALFNGTIDFIVGNHISPYRHVAAGKPIVCIASPGNFVNGRLISREPFNSTDEMVAAFKGRQIRVADCHTLDEHGALRHGRGNHYIEMFRAGFAPDDIEWQELDFEHAPGLDKKVIDAVKSGRADIGFGYGRFTEELEREGLHEIKLPTLPMVNGSTITTSYEALAKKERLAERLVEAMVLTIHYARTQPEKAQQLFNTNMGRPYLEHRSRVESVSRYRQKPYPDTAGIANVYELCTMVSEEAKTIQPMAVWDMHYLRELDQTGFIDELMQEQPEDVREPSGNPS
jgi:ABC-type nitrate/sulfonate/bicarbonate transport system substrate-binding protein